METPFTKEVYLNYVKAQEVLEEPHKIWDYEQWKKVQETMAKMGGVSLPPERDCDGICIDTSEEMEEYFQEVMGRDD